ncbi:MAG: DAK2 domain-containing protein [Eubacterium sp.]|nr:DAK2 domain-containing protein [Eubacterium sp.]
MIIRTLSTADIRKCFLAGANALDARKEIINDLNVFPVPDGDTGTNMTMTIMSAAREVAALEEDADMQQLCKAISSGSLRGARGNSGVILSQLLRGFTKEIKKAEEVDVQVLTKAFEHAVASAYKAVMKPKEGTILTVARAGSEKALQICDGTENIIELVNSVVLYMRDVLDMTPDMLPVLKEAGVVDSGGEGLLTILEGAYDCLLGKNVNYDIKTSEGAASKPSTGAKTEAIADVDIKYGYCTEFIIMLEKKFTRQDELEFKAYLESIGDSIVCVADEDIVKIHVHTNDPGLAIQKALTYGSLTRMKIDNMREEHNERVIRDADRKAQEQKEAEKQAEEMPHKEHGFISVSVGDGLNDIFRELGVDYVIEGGQTMNPSTEDILDAISKVNADNIFLLPNNSNIILACEQAKDLTKDKSIYVIPTKNIPQGITAMINFVEGISAEENAETMKASLSEVKAGQVTYAVRDTSVDGKTIKAGDIMGLSDKTIETVGSDIVDTTVALLSNMLDEDSELVTIYIGQEGSMEDARKIEKEVKKIDSELEVEIQYGGQPIYYYFLSVE